MGQDKGKARRAASSKLNVERAGRKAKTINQAILGPIGEKAAMSAFNAGKAASKAVQTTQRASQNVLNEAYKKARTNPTKNLSDAAQFGSKAAQNVIREAQGLAKMVVKGFGN